VGWENRITRTAPKDFELSINSLEFKKIFSKIISDQGKLIPDSEKMYWELFFSYSLDHSPMPLIQSYMNIFLKQYGSSVLLEDLREMCRILKEFSHVGLIKSIHEYGIYVHPLTFKSKNLLFLHLNHIEIYLPDGMGVDNMIGQEIDFRIIGFKPEPTERINITMLSDEQIELQIREANNNF
jgi:hypothetical protein